MRRLARRAERHLVEQLDDALDQLREPLERGQEDRRRRTPPAKQAPKPHAGGFAPLELSLR